MGHSREVWQNDGLRPRWGQVHLEISELDFGVETVGKIFFFVCQRCVWLFSQFCLELLTLILWYHCTRERLFCFRFLCAKQTQPGRWLKLWLVNLPPPNIHPPQKEGFNKALLRETQQLILVKKGLFLGGTLGVVGWPAIMKLIRMSCWRPYKAPNNEMFCFIDYVCLSCLIIRKRIYMWKWNINEIVSIPFQDNQFRRKITSIRCNAWKCRRQISPNRSCDPFDQSVLCVFNERENDIRDIYFPCCVTFSTLRPALNGELGW